LQEVVHTARSLHSSLQAASLAYKQAVAGVKDSGIAVIQTLSQKEQTGHASLYKTIMKSVYTLHVAGMDGLDQEEEVCIDLTDDAGPTGKATHTQNRKDTSVTSTTSCTDYSEGEGGCALNAMEVAVIMDALVAQLSLELALMVRTR